MTPCLRVVAPREVLTWRFVAATVTTISLDEKCARGENPSHNAVAARHRGIAAGSGDRCRPALARPR
jgi:hypothetical protein